MKAVLLILFLLASNGICQLSIINDPDGFVNVRDSQSVKSNIVEKLYPGDVFFVFGFEGDYWVELELSSDCEKIFDKELAGSKKREINYGSSFIAKNHIISISDLPKTGVSYYSHNQLTIKNDSIEIIIKTKAFNKKDHRIKYTDNFVSLIDNEIPYGVDGELPTNEISSITLKITGIEIEIPKNAYSNYYQPNLKEVTFNFDRWGYFYLNMPTNSDGAGGYDVVWVFKNNKLIKTCAYHGC